MLSASVTRAVNRRGTPTLINGATVQGVWMRAQPGRIQMFLDAFEGSEPAYEVVLPASVLQAPYSLAPGLTITWVNRGWRAVVRTIDIIDTSGSVDAVVAIVQLMSE